MGTPHTEAQRDAIRNACYKVRHYGRGGRSSIQAAQRAQAIRQLGLIVREAFAQSEDFETLLATVVDGLRPKDDPPF